MSNTDTSPECCHHGANSGERISLLLAPSPSPQTWSGRPVISVMSDSPVCPTMSRLGRKGSFSFCTTRSPQRAHL